MTGYVYAISNGRGHIKIGWAKKPERRLAELNVADADKLELLGYASGTKEHEAAIHKLLEAWRERGEWYRDEGGVRLFIDMLPKRYIRPAARRLKCNNHPLNVFRRRRNLTLKELGRMADVSHAQLCRIENGHHRPSFRLVDRLIKISGGALSFEDFASRAPLGARP